MCEGMLIMRNRNRGSVWSSMRCEAPSLWIWPQLVSGVSESELRYVRSNTCNDNAGVSPWTCRPWTPQPNPPNPAAEWNNDQQDTRTPVYHVAPSQHTQLELACFLSLPRCCCSVRGDFQMFIIKRFVFSKELPFSLSLPASEAIKSTCAVGLKQWAWPHRRVLAPCCYLGSNTPTAACKAFYLCEFFWFYYRSISCYQDTCVYKHLLCLHKTLPPLDLVLLCQRASDCHLLRTLSYVIMWRISHF